MMQAVARNSKLRCISSTSLQLQLSLELFSLSQRTRSKLYLSLRLSTDSQPSSVSNAEEAQYLRYQEAGCLHSTPPY